MSYIIELLMKHDEFESLLSYKGTEKVTKMYSISTCAHPFDVDVAVMITSIF